MPIKTGAGKAIDCYASSIHKTDKFIKTVYEYLSGQKFSMIYFSDHGMNFVGKAPKYEVLRDDKVQASYKIPFVLTSSDMKESHVIKAIKSANNFFDYYPTWLGVKLSLLTGENKFLTEDADTVMVQGYEDIFDFVNLKSGITAEEY